MNQNLNEFADAINQFQTGISANADSVRFNLEQMAKYFSGYTEEQGLSDMSSYDPFKYNSAATSRLALRIKEKKKTQPNYVTKEEDYTAILDPLSLALSRDQKKLVSDLGEYLHPYVASFSLATKKVYDVEHAESHQFLLKLGVVRNGQIEQVLSEFLSFENAYNKIKYHNDIFLYFDGLVEKQEAVVNRRLPRTIEESVVKRAKESLSNDGKQPGIMSEMEKLYFDRYMVMSPNGIPQYNGPVSKKAEKQTKKAYERPKVRQQLLCPDHGNPMMRKKGDNNHLYCTVVGCTKVLKRKVPLDHVPSPPTPPEPPEVPQVDAEELPEELQEEKTSEQIAAQIVATNIQALNPIGFVNPNQTFVINTSMVYLHQEGGRTFLVQDGPLGGQARIDITQSTASIQFMHQAVNYQSFAHNGTQYMPGQMSAQLVMDGLQIR